MSTDLFKTSFFTPCFFIQSFLFMCVCSFHHTIILKNIKCFFIIYNCCINFSWCEQAIVYLHMNFMSEIIHLIWFLCVLVTHAVLPAWQQDSMTLYGIWLMIKKKENILYRTPPPPPPPYLCHYRWFVKFTDHVQCLKIKPDQLIYIPVYYQLKTFCSKI